MLSFALCFAEYAKYANVLIMNMQKGYTYYLHILHVVLHIMLHILHIILHILHMEKGYVLNLQYCNIAV